jgi:hypothetical protein
MTTPLRYEPGEQAHRPFPARWGRPPVRVDYGADPCIPPHVLAEVVQRAAQRTVGRRTSFYAAGKALLCELRQAKEGGK